MFLYFTTKLKTNGTTEPANYQGNPQNLCIVCVFGQLWVSINGLCNWSRRCKLQLMKKLPVVDSKLMLKLKMVTNLLCTSLHMLKKVEPCCFFSTNVCLRHLYYASRSYSGSDTLTRDGNGCSHSGILQHSHTFVVNYLINHMWSHSRKD